MLSETPQAVCGESSHLSLDTRDTQKTRLKDGVSEEDISILNKGFKNNFSPSHYNARCTWENARVCVACTSDGDTLHTCMMSLVQAVEKHTSD